LPEPIFNEIARLSALSNVEVIPLYQDPIQKNISVLMLKRESNDKYWADMWHTPGSIIIATDKCDPYYQDALDRILKKELQNPDLKGLPVCFDEAAEDTFRGRILSKRFWIEVTNFQVGSLFRVDDLPPLFEGQAELIYKAAKYFKSTVRETN
jgi:hypothetical protein